MLYNKPDCEKPYMISCEDVYVCVYKNHVENIGIFCHEICVVRDDSRYNMLESFD